MTNSGATMGRIDSLDILRGMAILGILFLNITIMGNSWQGFDTPALWGWGPLDRASWVLSELMFEGTQRGLLQLIFGATALIMTRAAMGPRGSAPPAAFLRRNLSLMLFGAIDFTLLLWPGDVLFDYGLAGLFLLPFRRFSARALLLTGGGLIALLSIFAFLGHFEHENLRAKAEVAASLPAAKRDAGDRQTLQDWQEAQATVDMDRLEAERRSRLGGYADNLGLALERAVRIRATPFYLLYVLESFATMLIGMALFKWGVLQGNRSIRFYARLLAAGYGFGFLINGIEIWTRLTTGFAVNPLLLVSYELGRIPTTIGHVALVHLILSTSCGARLLSCFVAPGRMALSCYVSQTLICCWLLFPGFGLGLYGTFGQAELAGIAALITALQLVVCPLWLRRFGTGPLEAVLRRMSGRNAPRPAIAL